MLMNIFRVLVNNTFKKKFLWKKKKINILTIFFISYKSGVLKWIVNQCPESIR